MDGRTVGILGGGQLGRMMAEAASRLGIRLAILDPAGSTSPAGQLASFTMEGSFQDSNKIKELASISDIITTEIEHVNTDILEELEKNGIMVRPSAKTIRIIQDKYLQKEHLSKNNIPLPEYMSTPTIEEAHNAGFRFGYPFMLKNRKLAYDGKGNFVVRSPDQIVTAFEILGGNEIYAEKWVSFQKEIAVMVVRTKENHTLCYPVVETIQENNVCHLVIAPAQISSRATEHALEIAGRAIASFDGIGIYGVELFLLSDDTVLLNEIAPRPHNSGHYTIEACEVDQFEMHLRAILDLPCPEPRLRVGGAVMVNVLGRSDNMEETKRILHKALYVPGAGVHWYGKSESRIGRKMAHITVTGDDWHMVRTRLEHLGIGASQHGLPAIGARVGIIMGSDSDLPTMQEAAAVLDAFDVSYELTIVSAHRTPTRMYSYAQSAAERGIQVIIAGAGGAAHLPGMVAALTSLPVIGVPVKTSTLNGQDSLYSIVQMPKGIPVATVAIGNAANAGLLAVRTLAAQDVNLRRRMDAYLEAQEEEVLRKAARLEAVGHKVYLDGATKH
eukprot:gene5610-6177_t